MSKTIYFLGIDGGGSKCRARIVSTENEILGRGVAGSANILEGFEHSTGAILDATYKALDDAKLPHAAIKNLVAGIGLAGANVPELHQSLMSWEHPFKEMHVASDLHIACLGAHGGEDGAVIITGTGSSGYSNVEGVTTEYGGHGFPVGDKGAGAWLGLKALQHGLRAEGNLGRQTVLTSMLMDYFDVTELLPMVSKIARAKPSEYAKLAPMVFEAAEDNDDVAIDIIQDGAGYISRMARELLKKNPSRLSILGGVSERLKHWLDQEVASKLVDPIGCAEEGAVLFAKQKMNS
ncbi:MAG: N-acetylglucosamine kinase [Kordiimonas sp.]